MPLHAKKPELLNQDRLKQAGSVKYFLDTLKPFFVEDRGHVFLWRFLRLFKFGYRLIDGPPTVDDI